MKKQEFNPLRIFVALILLGMFGYFAGCRKGKYEEGMKYLAEGKYWEASKYYQQKLKDNPKNPVLENQLGYSYAKLGKLPEAEKHYQKAIELKPGYPEAHYNLGFLYMQGPRLKLDEAVKEFDQAIAARKDYAKAYSNRSIAHGYLGHFDQARKDIEKAISLEPENPVFKANRDWLEQMEVINTDFQQKRKAEAGKEKPKVPEEPPPK